MHSFDSHAPNSIHFLKSWALRREFCDSKVLARNSDPANQAAAPQWVQYPALGHRIPGWQKTTTHDGLFKGVAFK